MLNLDKSRLKRKLTRSTNHFHSLARSIIYQQISTKAGDSIHKRFKALFGKRKPTPRTLLMIQDASLRGVGLSNQKLSYLRDLAKKFEDGTINSKLFPSMSDQEIKTHLIQVKGVGPWTADMFLIFALNRPNVLPIGDLGVMKGFQKAFGLRDLPSEKRMRALAKPHDGEHTYLALYLWQIMDGEGGENW